MYTLLDQEVSFEKMLKLAKRAKADAGLCCRKSQVVLAVDASGSNEYPDQRFFSQGFLDQVARRVLALAQALDDDGSIPVYGFNHRAWRVEEPLAASNVLGYMKRNFRATGGTNYAPLIQRITADIRSGDPAIVFIFTDGDNGDPKQTEAALMAASHLPIFWQFVGVWGRGKMPDFTFLRHLDRLPLRLVDNVGFSSLSLHYDFDEQTFYERALAEYAGYHDLAQAAGLLDRHYKWIR